MAKAPKAAAAPILTCPFTGLPVEIVFSDTLGMHQVRGTFYQTKWYHTRDELMREFSTRNGVQPTFAKRGEITIVEKVEPPHALQDALKPRPLSDASSAAIDNIVDTTLRGG